MGMADFTVALMMIGVIISHCVYGKELSDQQEIKVQRLLKRLNKQALISIKSEDGDIIDCVPIHNQPAFDHPLLKNHTIEMRPSFIPEDTSTYTKKTTKVTQVWHKNGRCPHNTVPIRRVMKEDILRSESIESFGRKMTPRPLENTYYPSKDHEYATMNYDDNEMSFGTQFAMNIWKPEVQDPKEFSLAQTWLVSGVGNTRNTIEVGLQVYPRLNGDNNLRLFVYWTADEYQETGCYNLKCPGFVQISSRIVVGGTYTRLSQYGGVQYELSIHIWKDTQNWWLKIGEELVGYWPSNLFTSLGDGATRVEWGGEITNYWTDNGKHTSTDMGSGHFAEGGFRKASFFKNLMIVDGTNNLREPQGIYPIVTNHNCYNIKTVHGGTWGLNFFYGGPGQSEKCP